MRSLAASSRRLANRARRNSLFPSCFLSLLSPYAPSIIARALACIASVPYRPVFAVSCRHARFYRIARSSHRTYRIVPSSLVAYGRPALLVERRGGKRGDTGSPPPLLSNIEHGTERDVPLLCIAALPPYLAASCYIVVIVERAIVETRR